MPRAHSHGRGATTNPAGRFEPIEYVVDEYADLPPDEVVSIATRFFRDPSRTIISCNDSPDIGFDRSVNPYRGCEHGCIYCYARPTHEYLGYSPGLDFETKILVRENAPALLRKELSSPRWVPQPIALSGVTDCYQPVEKRMRLTRGCLEVLAEFRNPALIVTKNQLVARDVDVLSELARFGAVSVQISITTLDPGLARSMEPRASSPAKRIEAIRVLADAGIPVGVLAAPIVPAINEHEIPAILAAAASAGAGHAGYQILRLPYAVKDLFVQWVEENFPDRKQKIVNRIRELRDGKLNDPEFGKRMRGEGIFAEQIGALFEIAVRKTGLRTDWPELSAASFRVPRPASPQMRLFG